MQEQQLPQNLLNEYDKDPGRWRPLMYPVFIDVPVISGNIGRGSITINAQPFVLVRLTHQIVGNTGDPEASGLYQDGQYTIGFQDEISNYQKQPVMADLAFGSVRSGYFANLAIPIPFAGNRTVSFELANQVQRVLTPVSETFRVSITMIGLADWGELRPPERR
jgi:hypothetical protein